MGLGVGYMTPISPLHASWATSSTTKNQRGSSSNSRAGEARPAAAARTQTIAPGIQLVGRRSPSARVRWSEKSSRRVSGASDLERRAPGGRTYP